MAEPTAVQKRTFAKMGIAMPDGSYYIRNAADLDNAISAVGRGEPQSSHNAIRVHIMKRAKALKLDSKIPDNWAADGSLTHSDVFEKVLVHFGVKGMKWGVRRSGSGGSSHPVSADHARAAASRAIVSKHGTSALSNNDLQHLVSRLNLEQQHNRLNPVKVSAGHQILNSMLKIGGNVAQQQATTFANQYAAKGIEHLIKQAG